MTAPIIAADFDSLRAELARTSISATTMNFIVWIDDVTFRDWVLERTTKILEKHPARAILLDGCADGKPGARLVRSERTDEDDAHITVLGERVEIGVAGMSTGEIAELTGSLTMNELPTLLWWTGEGIAGQPTFNALVDLADSLVIDSSGTRNDNATVIELVRFLSSRPLVGLRDLAWMRLRPWQDMIARFFDDPRLREELYSVRTLQIVSGSDAEALYLGGWLASRLGWTASGHDAFSDQSGNTIPFTTERDRNDDVQRDRFRCGCGLGRRRSPRRECIAGTIRAIAGRRQSVVAGTRDPRARDRRSVRDRVAHGRHAHDVAIPQRSVAPPARRARDAAVTGAAVNVGAERNQSAHGRTVDNRRTGLRRVGRTRGGSLHRARRRGAGGAADRRGRACRRIDATSDERAPGGAAAT
jgi:hypothetical protein